ncbi:MAG: hypothetical protein LBF68_01135 [Christensenellaceae bacterium]|jgi:transposase-like protein|nr:hypothetical protein [Christensenellaceae bacterium]
MLGISIYSINEKEAAVKSAISGELTKHEICIKYGCARCTLNRWLKSYDGTLESISPKPKRQEVRPTPHSPEERVIIIEALLEHPNYTYAQLWNKIRTEKNYSRKYLSMINFIKKDNLRDLLL